MHLIKVTPCGPLAGRFRPIEIMASTAAEAIEGWSRQVSRTMIDTVVQPVGFATEEALRAPTDATEIKLYPAMFGGSGFGKIIMGAVMIGLSFIPGIGQAIQAALIVSGATTALMGVVELFMKSPSLSKEQDPDASKYIGSGVNTTKIGTIIGMGGGRMLIGGQYLSLQVNSSELVYGQFPTTTS